ncbi:NAD(P)-binding protein [Didymella exigua CBS 183.55]|uniref:NAD(P)-binding protein n=1 Tax=Didymella exigua CBS 183.55 TaxID=1150837 RepID=A0A6A5S1N4_9PLEO|nr:NAD(P)-binding protein [Didymella exigua CBS 183.55]KAF1934032.1 NAD(P)-binding protein [Didymella exigua CBS 183.55]
MQPPPGMSQTDFSFGLMLLERDNKHLIAMARKELQAPGSTPTEEVVHALVTDKRRAQGKKQVALIVGASRGIGRQIAIDLAKEGYAVVVAAKSTSNASSVSPFPPDPNSSASTISTVEREIHDAGGTATAIPVDTRSPLSIATLFAGTLSLYGHIDVIVYNSGAIWWSSVQNTPFKRFQLMQQVNVEGLYAVVQAALPQFEKQGWKGRIIVVSPPIYSRFFRGKTAYAMGKVGMSVLTKGLAMDWQREGKMDMAITSIWPAVTIESAATQNVEGENRKDLRKPTIYSDAILEMLRAEPKEVNGCLELDEDFLRKRGYRDEDFEKYNVLPGVRPRRIMPKELPNLTVAEQDDEGKRVDSTKLRATKL